MPNINTDLFDLIKTLSENEKELVMQHVFVYKKGGNNFLMQLFKLLDKQKKYNEKELRTTINNLPNRKKELWKKIMTVLRADENEAAEMKARKALDFIYLLIDRKLYPPAYKLLIEVKKWCDDYYRLDYKNIALQYERLIIHYIVDTDIPGHIKRIRTEILENGKEIYLWATVYDFYMRILEIADGPSIQRILTPRNDLVKMKDDPVFLLSQEGMSLPVLTNYAKAKSTIYFAQKDYDKCYELENPVTNIYRSKKEKSYYELQAYRIWLLNRMALHQNARNFSEWKIDLDELDNLIRSHFEDEIITLCVYHHFRFLYHYEYDKFRTTTHLIKETEDFIQKFKAKIPVPRLIHMEADLSSAFMNLGLTDKAWHYCHNILNSDFNDVSPDIQEFMRIFLLFILLEKKEYGQLENQTKRYAKYIKDKTDGNYTFDKLIVSFMKKMLVSPKEKGQQKKLFALLKGEISGLLEQKHLHTIEMCDLFDFKDWASRKSV